MKLLRLVLGLATILGTTVLCAQQVFMYRDEAGRPVFTDRPPANEEAEAVDLPPPGAAPEVLPPDRRLDRLNEMATLLRDDRARREARRDELQRRAAEQARREEEAAGAAAAAQEPVVIGGWYPFWRPPYGHRPGRGPDFRPPRPPGEHPPWLRPPRPEPWPPGGRIRAGRDGAGW